MFQLYMVEMYWITNIFYQKREGERGQVRVIDFGTNSNHRHRISNCHQSMALYDESFSS